MISTLLHKEWIPIASLLFLVHLEVKLSNCNYASPRSMACLKNSMCIICQRINEKLAQLQERLMQSHALLFFLPAELMNWIVL